jgi:endonuclease V-like protein UPF0215 family
MAYIISADELKKSLSGYTPDKAEAYHETSAKLADKVYSAALKDRPEDTVILMSGGTASGKSEYVSVYLEGKEVIVLDGTLPTLEGASIKLRSARKAGKLVEIHSVMPASFPVAFAAFLNRDRKFPVEHFYRTHSSSRRTLLEVAEQFPDVPIKIVVSTGDPASGMTFTEQQFADRQQMIEYVKRQQYTEEEIRNHIYYD